GRSAGWQLTVGFVVLTIGLALSAGLVWGLVWGSVALIGGGLVGFLHLFNLIARCVASYFDRRRRHSKVCKAITEALTRIAERCPTPELRGVLPELKVVAADVLQQDATARVASRKAAARIQSLTERLKSLPVPTAAP